MPVSPLRVQRGDLIRFLPEIILTVMGTLLMVLDPMLHKRSSNAFGHFSIAWRCWPRWAARCTRITHPGPAFGGMLMVDGFATFFRVLVIVVGILTVLAVVPVPGAARTRRPASTTRCCCSRSRASA